jgi:CRP/FNR family transcriptional regulator
MTARRLAPHEFVCQQGDVADAVFYVMEGVLKVYKLTVDGRRQIVGFLGVGDFLGVGYGEECSFSAEAVTAAKVGRISRSKLDGLIEEFPLLGRRMLGFARKELLAAQEHLLLLGRMTPIEKVASFLARLAERDGSRRIELPMSRQDIADHLGLTIETVSRCFTRLRKAGVIDLLRADDVVVRCPDRLADVAAGEDEGFRQSRAA